LQRQEPPLIVFSTAYDQHAIQAFELRALDYILKPYRPQRLAETLARVRAVLAERAVLVRKERVLREYLHDAIPATMLTKLWGESEDGLAGVLVDFSDIMWIEVTGKRVCAHTLAGGRVLVRLKMQELEERLSAHNFARVHRSTIVNLDHVAAIHPWFSGTYLIDMRDAEKTQIPMSRNFGRQLKQLTGWG
jgi:DNA-binding LytR/AlgR family response regulator